MYLMHLPFYLVLILAKLPDVSFETIEVLFTIGFVASFLMIPVCITSLIFALTVLGREISSPLKTTLVIKLCLIPWYILNCVISLLMVAGFLNPWLFMAVPLLIAFEVVITYVYMISTTIHSVIYTIKYLHTQKIQPSTQIIVALVLHFIFCLDIIGAIMLNAEMKKQNLCH